PYWQASERRSCQLRQFPRFSRENAPPSGAILGSLDGLVSQGKNARHGLEWARTGPYHPVNDDAVVKTLEARCRDQRHDSQDQGLFRLRLTLLLPSGVSASRGYPGQRGRGRVDALRASARTAPDASARRRLPPAGLVAVRLPHRPQNGRADQPAARVTP